MTRKQQIVYTLLAFYFMLSLQNEFLNALLLA